MARRRKYRWTRTMTKKSLKLERSRMLKCWRRASCFFEVSYLDKSNRMAEIDKEILRLFKTWGFKHDGSGTMMRTLPIRDLSSHYRGSLSPKHQNRLRINAAGLASAVQRLLLGYFCEMHVTLILKV